MIISIKDNSGIKNQDGLFNTSREIRFLSLINKSILRFKPRLDDLVILTEAASGSYASTALASALAGAKRVIAIAKPSKYATVKEIKRTILSCASKLGVDDIIEFSYKKTKNDIINSDIVTNLRFVRPIDKWTVEQMKTTAAIPLMYESWEFRGQDIDVKTCAKRGIPVCGTNEERLGADTFKFCGVLALKLLLNAGIECDGSKIAIVSNDKFGASIYLALEKIGARVHLVKNLYSKQALNTIKNSDGIVLADYSDNVLIGNDGQITWASLRNQAPSVTVIQICGIARCKENHRDITCIPDIELEPHRMSHTLSYLSPKPVIDLNVASLRIGEVVTRARLDNATPEEAVQRAVDTQLGQKLLEWYRYR
jgi:hypothetical protein